MCQVNGDGHFRPPGAPKPLNRFTWNLARVIMSTVRQHMQNMVAAEMGGGVGIWVKLYLHVLFYYYFWFLQCVHSLPWEASVASIPPRSNFPPSEFPMRSFHPFLPSCLLPFPFPLLSFCLPLPFPHSRSVPCWIWARGYSPGTI